jgi:L-aminopeptidase/D-esterase-like protein
MELSMTDSLTLKTGADAILPPGFVLGHCQDEDAATGCSVVICEQGAIAGVSVRGAAPATRETDLLEPTNTVQQIQAVILSGGSAFGLDAAGGVMKWLSERDLGFAAPNATVPIVCGASLYDLTIGESSRYPDADTGYTACETAVSEVAVGNIGAGTGATVGKLLGDRFAMKSGFGAASTTIDDLVITALVAVNAVGNVYDRETGTQLAGARNPLDTSSILNPYECLQAMRASIEPSAATTNTTIGCLLTNGVITKSQATHIADMAHDGYARAIEPIHTGFDGDAVFVLSSSGVDSLPDLIGALGARVMEEAIHDAALSANSAFGYPAARDLPAQQTEENRFA